MTTGATTQPLIQVHNLSKHYRVRGGFRKPALWVKAVDDVSFDIAEGETLGVVGESGCGKTTLGHTMLRLIEPSGGQVILKPEAPATGGGSNILALSGDDMKAVRRQMQVIFQDPYGSLSPRMPVGEQVIEGMRIHGIGTADERAETMLRLMRQVGLEDYHANRYPHEFSGGQQQRVGIARALALRPRFILCDEPVSALDVSIQSQVLNLLHDLQAEYGLTYLFIAHNLNVVEHISRRVAVMYLGKIVELATREDIYKRPMHPYTQALLAAIPIPDPKRRHRKRLILTGDVPSPVNPPSGCRFHTRCPLAFDQCKVEEPLLSEVNDASREASHLVACWRAGESAFL